jgi:hypothetical protein
MASPSLQPLAARWGELLRCQLGAHVTRSHYAARRSMLLRPPPVPEKGALDVVNNPLSTHPGAPAPHCSYSLSLTPHALLPGCPPRQVGQAAVCCSGYPAKTILQPPRPWVFCVPYHWVIRLSTN